MNVARRKFIKISNKILPVSRPVERLRGLLEIADCESCNMCVL